MPPNLEVGAQLSNFYNGWGAKFYKLIFVRKYEAEGGGGATCIDGGRRKTSRPPSSCANEKGLDKSTLSRYCIRQFVR